MIRRGPYRSIIAMRGATIEAALAAERKSAPSRDVKFLVFHVFLLAVICSGVVVPARARAGASESFMIPFLIPNSNPSLVRKKSLPWRIEYDRRRKRERGRIKQEYKVRSEQRKGKKQQLGA